MSDSVFCYRQGSIEGLRKLDRPIFKAHHAWVKSPQQLVNWAITAARNRVYGRFIAQIKKIKKMQLLHRNLQLPSVELEGRDGSS